MDNIVNILVNQVPDLVALIFVVMIFLNRMEKIETSHASTVKALQEANAAYLAKRDEIYIKTVNKMADELERLIETFQQHARETTDSIAEMRRTAARLEKKAKA